MAAHARASDTVARTRVWMSGVRDRIRFLREGLFAKYVISLVGLVVFVLAVNGAMETWISYRGTKTTLTDGMSEKAEATARRIEQSVAELERQISWVTRASATKQHERDTMEQRRNDYAQLLNQVPAVNQLSFLNGSGREQLRLSRLTIAVNSNIDFSRDLRFTETVARSVTYAPAYFRDARPLMSIAVSHSGFKSPSPKSTCASCRTFWATPRSASPVLLTWSTRRAWCWQARPRVPMLATTFRTCRKSRR
jgi:hypothetical protein